MNSDGRGEDMTKTVNLVLTGFPWNTLEDQNLDNFAHDVISNDDMKQFGEVGHKLQARGGNDAIFCFSYQFSLWYQFLGAREEQEEEHDREDPKSTSNISKRVFTVYQKQLNFVRTNGNFLTTPFGRSLSHKSMDGNTTHLWQNGKNSGEPTSFR